MTRRNAKGLLAHVNRRSLLKLAAGGALISLGVNLAALTSPLFFTQVYDRVLTTGSVATLIALTGIALIMIAFGAVFEQVRSSLFIRAGAELYADLEPHVYRACHLRSLAGAQGRRGQPFDDLESLRGLISGPLPTAALDLVFAPLFLAVLFAVHFYVGLFALVVMALMTAIAAVTQWVIRGATQRAHLAQLAAADIAETQLRAAEAITAMGYMGAMRELWAKASRTAVRENIRASFDAGFLFPAARAVRNGAQILVIAIAAALALQGGVSPGAIVATSIILARLLGPIDQLLGGWRQLTYARDAQERLGALLDAAPPPTIAGGVAPRGRLVFDGLSAATPAGATILRGINLSVEEGEILAVIGPVGSGKSTLLRCALGVWPMVSGAVRLDGAPLREVDHDRIGKYLGFLPQNADLVHGTIAENIRRFGPDDPDGVLRAVEAVDAHDVIAAMPRGFDTDVGEAGSLLSAGQRRRIALARALYGDPVLVCLDEPEAHLDAEGEAALQNALRALKERGATVLLAAHRPSVVGLADRILVLRDGRATALGPAAEILKTVTPPSLRRVT